MQEPDSLTPSQRAEILLNRTNVALARSQRLIDSWLPPKPQSSSGVVQRLDDDDEESFKSMSETAGVGSAKAFAAEEESARRKIGLTKGNERLLETMLGRKGAREKMRSLGNGSGVAGGHVAVKKMDGVEAEPRNRNMVQADNEVENEDEEDRVARFGERKRRRIESNEGELEKLGKSEDELARTPNAARVEKRKPVSYLDELLAGKKSKKNKKKHAENNAAPAT
nr:uncharacterized protein LOC112019701 [Quercus suber]POF16584.1 hypothetical protein CFP56_24102 [Quercus suber]